MTVWSSSLTGRACTASAAWIGVAWRASLVARWLGGVAVWGRSVARGSRVLSVESARSWPLTARRPSSFVGAVIVWVYTALARILGESWLGRTVRRCGRGVADSVLADGGSWRVLGAGMAGWGAARALRVVLFPGEGQLVSAEIAVAAAVALAGVVAMTAGVGFAPGWRSGAVGWLRGEPAGASQVGRSGTRGAEAGAARRPSSRARARRVGAAARGGGSFRLVAVMAAALVAGVSAGAASGATGLMAWVIVAVVLAVVVVPFRPELLLLLFAAFPWVDWAARRSLGAFGGAWDEMVLLGSFACLLWVVLVVRRWDLRTVPLLIPAALAVVAAIASVVLRSVPADVGMFAVRVTFQPLLFYFLGYLLPRDARFVRWAVVVFLAASLALATHGLYQYATGAPMPAKWVDAHETSVGTRAYSIIENPNGLGAFLIMGTVVSATLALARIRARQRLAAAAVTVVLAAGVAVTFSRGAWLALVFGLVAAVALSRWRVLAALTVGAVAVAFVAPRTLVDRLTFAFSDYYLTKSSSSGRLLMYGRALDRTMENPFTGVGLGMFGGTSAFLFGWSVLWVDSFYLQMMAEGGLVLLAAFLWVLVRAGKGLILAYREQADPLMAAVVAGVFGAFAAVCFANLTVSAWEALTVGAVSWFLVGMASAPLDAGFRLTPVSQMPVDVRDGRR